MKRKFVYAALALPVVVFLVLFLMMPAPTRATFVTEFQHRFGMLFGYEPPKPTDSGLRLDHPEEYGPQPGGEVESDDDDASEVESKADPAELQTANGQ